MADNPPSSDTTGVQSHNPNIEDTAPQERNNVLYIDVGGHHGPIRIIGSQLTIMLDSAEKYYRGLTDLIREYAFTNDDLDGDYLIPFVIKEYFYELLLLIERNHPDIAKSIYDTDYNPFGYLEAEEYVPVHQYLTWKYENDAKSTYEQYQEYIKLVPKRYNSKTDVLPMGEGEVLECWSDAYEEFINANGPIPDSKKAFCDALYKEYTRVPEPFIGWG
ncbi:hypothetical protein UCDDS831_g07491 [Diplodia seriata]|uniref:Uncharacterized protein n=1 Tax=Diplodia seriata TaxID=420778 RepID=A0A0G2E009_9PEZI|nr:hypothetical protein UCDDS831_g07491 [Diplodia seriata]